MRPRSRSRCRMAASPVAPPGRTLSEVLNAASTFIEFEPAGAPRIFIAKSDVSGFAAECRPGAEPPPSAERRRLQPIRRSGVTADADKDKVHRAYIHLAKIYHPDQYATTGLPAEDCDYLASMARRI